jgi:hypothetical protein
MKKNVFYATAIMVATFILLSCQKENTPPISKENTPQKDLADYFVGTYTGNFREDSGTNTGGILTGMYFHSTLAFVTKQSANQVTFQVENFANSKTWRIKGVVKDSANIEFPTQTIDSLVFSNLGAAYRSFKAGNNDCDTSGLDPKLIKFAVNFKLKYDSQYTTVSFYGQK